MFIYTIHETIVIGIRFYSLFRVCFNHDMFAVLLKQISFFFQYAEYLYRFHLIFRFCRKDLEHHFTRWLWYHEFYNLLTPIRRFYAMV